MATAALFAAYFAVGHGLHAPNDGMASMHGPGICLVLIAALAALGAAVLRLRPPRPPERPPRRIALPTVPLLPPGPFAPARASPAWLQVFLR